MKNSKIYIILFFSLVVLLVSCDDKSLSPIPPKDPDFSLTPMENEEAELAALHLSGKLIAPLPLYRQIKEELELIRETWSDSITHVNIEFEPFYHPSIISIWVSPPTHDSIVAGTYHHWDSLNDYYRIDTIMPGWRHDKYGQITLRFKGRLNSLVLLFGYAGLPGFKFVTFLGKVGDYPVLHLIQDRDEIKYFFRHAYGDCPAGCISSEYYYFRVENDRAYFIGSFLDVYPNYPPDSLRPAWMDTVVTAHRKYLEFDCWHVDDFEYADYGC